MKRRKFIGRLAGTGLLSLNGTMKIIAQTAAHTDNYVIEQFEDKGLAHFSYAILVGKKMIVIDPQRNPEIYYAFAHKNDAQIVGVIETHPHADFVSAHLEMHLTAQIPIYTSSLTKAHYPLTPFDEGHTIQLSDKIRLRSMYTPGHAPDHIAVLLTEYGKDKIVFSGDSLFLGDVGRPDLLDYSKESDRQRQQLAELMYDTIQNKFAKLNDDVIVFPAHGAGSLCGKSIRKAASSTIGYERKYNYAFEKRSKDEFVALLLKDQPFIPQYFAYDVRLNHVGAPKLTNSLDNIPKMPVNFAPAKDNIVIDTRPEKDFKASHIPGAINIQAAGPFETWLGSLIQPIKAFYLVAGDDTTLETALKKTAAIGYEANVKGCFVYDAKNGETAQIFNSTSFNPADKKYTYLDIRSEKEALQQPILSGSINIPLQELPDRIAEIPKDKPILVYCASGYRSATASSLLQKYLPSIKVYDLSTSVNAYKQPVSNVTK